jgi:hypothetical protein
LDEEDFRVCDLINEQRASTQKQVATNPTPTLSFANTSPRLPPDCPPRSSEIWKTQSHTNTQIDRQNKE